jgi:hypothetical protein
MDARDGNNSTPLYYASQDGHLDAIRLLLDAGAQLEAKEGDDRNALAVAALNGGVEALLARDTNPNARNKLGDTPLMDAARNHHMSCVRELLPVSDLSITNKQGRNLLHYCITTGNQACFELLLPLMSDVDVRMVQGFKDPHQALISTRRRCTWPAHLGSTTWPRRSYVALPCGLRETATSGPAHAAARRWAEWPPQLRLNAARQAGRLPAHARRGERGRYA